MPAAAEKKRKMDSQTSPRLTYWHWWGDIYEHLHERAAMFNARRHRLNRRIPCCITLLLALINAASTAFAAEYTLYMSVWQDPNGNWSNEGVAVGPPPATPCFCRAATSFAFSDAGAGVLWARQLSPALVLAPGEAIVDVRMNVQCRYNADGVSRRVRMLAELPGLSLTRDSPVFSNPIDDEFCRYRMGSAASIFDLKPDGWTAADINALDVGVRRFPTMDTRLRVCAIRIRVVTECPDCDGDGVCDPAEPDCNANGTPDDCDLLSGSAVDCNDNGIPDSCDLATGTALDCNSNNIPDSCDLASGAAVDCNGNGTPDSCDIATGIAVDCDANGVPDSCDLASGAAVDCNGNAIPDSCDVSSGAAADCNGNGVPDSCDVAGGTTPDCNGNGVPDGCDLASGSALDCNNNGVPDSCDIASGIAIDCNINGIPDSCDIAAGTAGDCNRNMIPDECDLGSGASTDCNQNTVPDECDPDKNGNGIPDDCETCLGDINQDWVVNVLDLLELLAHWGEPDGSADLNEDGIVNVIDLLVLLALWGECP